MKNNISGDEVKVNRYHLDAESDSNRLTFHQLKQYHIVVRHCAFHQLSQYHMVVRSLRIPPVNTVPHSGRIIVHSTSQHSTT